MDAYIRIARTLLHLMFVALGVALVWYPAGGAASTSVLWVPAAKPWWDGGQKILHHYPSSLEFENPSGPAPGNDYSRIPLPPMLSAAAPVAKTEDRQLQTPQRRKTAPQTWWLARHSGHAAEPINAFVMRSMPWKPKPSKHVSAGRSIFAPSLITSQSCAVIGSPRIEPLQSLGLGHNALQHLIGATFGSPSEARDLVGGP